MGFPGGSDDKDSACSVRDGDLTLVWEMAPLSVLPGESHGRRSLVGHSPWGAGRSQRVRHNWLTFTSQKYIGYYHNS